MQYSGNKVIDKKEFDREWENYINYIFEDEYIYDSENNKEEYSSSDRDMEAWTYGCDVSTLKLSQADKIKIKRYRRDAEKR